MAAEETATPVADALRAMERLLLTEATGFRGIRRRPSALLGDRHVPSAMLAALADRSVHLGSRSLAQRVRAAIYDGFLSPYDGGFAAHYEIPDDWAVTLSRALDAGDAS